MPYTQILTLWTAKQRLKDAPIVTALEDDGSFTGIPALSKCMECHDDPESPLGESLEEKKFIEEYLAGRKRYHGINIIHNLTVSTFPISPM